MKHAAQVRQILIPSFTFSRFARAAKPEKGMPLQLVGHASHFTFSWR